MTSSNEALLESAGWTIECESPFEIRHEDGSFATGLAAHLVLASIQQENTDTLSLEDPLLLLQALSERLSAICARAQDLENEGRDLWKTAYNRVFCQNGSQKAYKLLGQLGESLDYHDPDEGYREDALAFVDALEAKVAELRLLSDL